MLGQKILDAYRRYLAGELSSIKNPNEVANDVLRALYTLGDTKAMGEALALFSRTSDKALA